MTAYSYRHENVNRETALATDVARMHFEDMRAVALADAFATFNADGTDDPPSNVQIAGNEFQVDAKENGLEAVGRIVLPVNADGELREDLDMPALGMPQDLNGDGLIDDRDHRDDYIVLPVLLRLSWRGSSGYRETVFTGMLLP
jgi:hypothetical protein